MQKKEVPECCEGCAMWEQFGEKCWIYWEAKKNCTQHTGNNDGLVL